MTTTTKAAKPANYSPEQEAKLSEMWKGGNDTAAIAQALGKSTRSIVAKLSRMFKGTEHEYKAKTHTRKDGAPVQKKEETATLVGNILGLSANDADSLTKCTRVTLQAIFKALANSVPVTPENSPAPVAKVDDSETTFNGDDDENGDENDDENE